MSPSYGGPWVGRHRRLLSGGGGLELHGIRHGDMETEDDAKNNDKEHCSGMDADTKDIRDSDVD